MFSVLKDDLSKGYASFGNKLRSYSDSLNDTTRRILVFLVVIAVQMLIILRIAISGVSIIFNAFTVVLLWDGLALLLRHLAHFRISRVLVYTPPIIYTIGVSVQATHAMFKWDPAKYLYSQFLKDTLAFLTAGVVAFLLKRLESVYLSNEKRYESFVYSLFPRVGMWVVTLGLFALTLAGGRSADGASVSENGVQLFSLIKVVFVVYMTLVFTNTKISTGLKVLESALFMAVCLVFFAMMSEFATLLITLLSYFLILIFTLDMSNFVFFANNIWHRKRLRIITLILLTIALIGFLVVYKDVSVMIQNKYNERIKPWLELEIKQEEMTSGIANAIEHKAQARCSIAAGGLFGISSIRHISWVSNFRKDVTFSMVVQLFGMLGGLLLAAMYIVFGYASRRTSARVFRTRNRTLALFSSFLICCQAFTAIGSALGILPIIGIGTPFVSKGGVDFVCHMILLAFITEADYDVCVSYGYEQNVIDERSAFQTMLDSSRKDTATALGRLKSFLVSRNFLKAALAVIAVVCAAILVLLSAANVFIDKKYGILNRSEMHRTVWSDEPEPEVADIPLISSDSVYNLLLIGADYGEEQVRSDAMILLSLNKRSGDIKLCSFMRDNYVNIPEKGKHKLNSAYSYGGAELVVRTIENNFRVRIDDYVEINMKGFLELVNGLDAVTIKITKEEAEYINRIEGSSLSAGTVRLTPREALTYARARKVEGELEGDRGRNARQQNTLIAIFSEYFGMLKRLELSKFNSAVDRAISTITTTVDNDTISDIMLPFVKGALKLVRNKKLADEGSHKGGNALEIVSVPLDSKSQKLYDNVFINGNDCVAPQLVPNVEFIREYIYG